MTPSRPLWLSPFPARLPGAPHLAARLRPFSAARSPAPSRPPSDAGRFHSAVYTAREAVLKVSGQEGLAEAADLDETYVPITEKAG